MSLTEKNKVDRPTEKISVEKVIDIVRQLRNDLVKDFLKGDNLQNYFAEHYGKSLSTIKKEFIIRDLQQVLISPVDLVHYSSLIKDFRETGSASLSQGNHELFFKEIEIVLEKYKY